MRIRYKIPTVRDQGPCIIVGVDSCIETAREDALWQYNRMREHDGQPPLAGLPLGTTSEVILEDSDD